MSENITFREGALEKALEYFGKSTDADGYIIDEEGRRVTSNLGNEVTLDDLGGLGKGSIVYIEDDFNSAAEYFDLKHGREE